MKSNYKVSGVISLWINEIVHTVLEYETSYQREQIIDGWMEKVKNIKKNVIIWYVISVNEESIRIPQTKAQHNRNRNKKEPTLEQLVRPKAEYSNTQFNDL